MNRSLLWLARCSVALICAVLLAPAAAFPQVISDDAQAVDQAISLVKEPPNALTATPSTESSLAKAPANFHNFASARVGEDAYPEQLTLRFAAPTELTGIESSKDFKVEKSSTCEVHRFYSAGDSCALLVRFTPQGAGRRVGKVAITHTASPKAFTLGLGGTGFAPVISFTPALISTVPGTFVSGAGLLNTAQNLTVDGGDIVYIADTGNNTVRELDSSGTLITYPGGGPIATPASLAVDNFGIIYTANTHGSTYYFSIYYPWGTQTAYGYAYASSTCTPSAPCAFSAVGMNYPANISIDTNNNLFMEEGTSGALEMPVGGISGGNGTLNLWHLSDQFAYSSGSPAAFAVDADDNLYTFYNFSTTTCFILQEPLYNAEHSPTAIRVAGGTACGFAGDGGLARNARIGSAVGQIAFDTSGNLYFSDSANQRVRRIDNLTGIITTIAGTGTAGYGGDGGPATSALLKSPTGVGVDSQGQVYVISGVASGATQVIRKLGPNGFLQFPGQLKGSFSAARLVTVANMGNAALTLTKAFITGTNPSEFSIDSNTTSCNLAPGGTLFAGQSCKVGILFKPAAKGTRKANLVLLDNTVTSSNTVELAGTGTLPAPTFTITSPASGTSVTAGTTITFAVSVTSSFTTKPTGTVAFKLDSTSLGSVAVSSGKASVSVKLSTVGTHTLSASYSGDGNYAGAGPITRGVKVQ